MMERSKMILFYAAVTAVVIAGHRVSSIDQSFAVEPEDMSAVVNTTVSLPCRVADLAGQLQWTKDDFALGTNRNLSYHGYPRYAMIGNDGNGEYNLKLNPVTLDDDGVYQCQVGTGKRDEPAIRSRKATLTVLVPPSRPRIARTYAEMPTENVPIELVCLTEGGKPPAEITWADDSGTVIEEGVNTQIEAWETDSRRFTTKSVLKLVPKMEHHNTSIWCRAHNAAIDKKLQTKINIQVKFAPKISLVIAGAPKKLVEGMDVRFLCLTKANPSEVTYRWFVNDQFAPNEVTPELWLNNISRRLHNSQVRCEAQNVVDKTEETKTLSISYKPQLKSRPKNIQAEAGQIVTTVCDVDSNPPASIEWTSERTKKVVSTTSNLTLIVSAATAGRYHCKATTAGFGEVNTNVFVHMKRAPVISSPRVQYGTPSDTVQLECTAASVPVPDRIVWTYHGTIIGIRNDQVSYSVLEDPTDDGVKSTLIIRNSKHEQFGAYNCTASNDYGSDSMIITLVPKRDFMMILAIMGAVGGIVVIIMIFCVIAFCRRTTSDKKKIAKTAEFNAESDCTENKQAAAAKESDASSNVSDIKMETGTGSSLSNYRYKLDYGSTGGGGADSMTITTTLDDQRRSTTPKSGGGGSQTTLTRGGGIPLAGPVPVDPRYTTVGGSGSGVGGYLGHQHNVMHHPLSNGTVVNDYTDPLNYVSRYNNHNSVNADRPTTSTSTTATTAGLSNGYIAADRLYDLNPPKMTSSVSAQKLHTTAELITRNGSESATTLLQYSAAYGNPFLRPNSVHWPPVAHKLDAYGRPEPPPYSSVKNQKRTTTKNAAAAAAQQAPNGPDHMHISVAKRQTLATHV